MARLRRALELIDRPAAAEGADATAERSPEGALRHCWQLFEAARRVRDFEQRMPVLDAIEACERLDGSLLPDPTARALHLQVWGECLEEVAEFPLEPRAERLAAAEAVYRSMLDAKRFDRVWRLQGHYRLGNLFHREKKRGPERDTWTTVRAEFRDLSRWSAYRWAELSLQD